MPARRVLTLFFFLLTATASLPAFAEDEAAEVPSVDEVIAKLDDLYRADSSHGTIEMRIESDRGTRTLEVEQWSKGDQKALMVIRSPAREAGTATLRSAKGLWNYAPRADRLIRIPSGLLSENWMGSHFTNDDLMRETSFHDDYKSDIEWAEVDGARRLKVTLTPRPKAPVVWEKIEYLMTADEWLPVRASYYDDGKVVRIMRFSNVKEFDGRKIPAVMELLPQTEGEKGEKTRVEYKEIKFDVGVDDGLFTQRGLRRVARQR
jgi:outer membrane lipoprotein-sorting protein